VDYHRLLFWPEAVQRWFAQRVSLPTARKLKNHPCVGSRNQ
jgi:hypothetical protein